MRPHRNRAHEQEFLSQIRLARILEIPWSDILEMTSEEFGWAIEEAERIAEASKQGATSGKKMRKII